MGCCKAEAEEDNRPLAEIKAYEKRSCTDVLFLLGFLAFWGLTIAILVKANQSGGDPHRIIRGTDMNGDICGVSANVRDRPFAAWPWPPTYRARVCVADCNETSTSDLFAWRGPSTQFLFYCIPIGNSTIRFSGEFNSGSAALTRSIGDVFTTWPLIVLSALGATFFSLIFTRMVKLCAGCLVWTVVLLTVVGGFFLSYVLLRKGFERRTEDIDQSQVNGLRWGGFVFLGLTLVFCLVVCFLRNRIQIAVAVVKEASRVFGDVPCLSFFPLVPLTLLLGYMAFWIYIAVTIYSVGKFRTEETPDNIWMDGRNPRNMQVHTWDRNFQNAAIVHFFGLLWHMQFLVYFCYLVVSGTVADWYFSARDANGEYKKRGNGFQELSTSPTLDSLKRTCRFHLGTVLFGSLIIAMIMFARAVLTYIQKKTGGEHANAVQRAVFGIVQCLLNCCQCCIDAISKNAFVWTAIWGSSFCPASCNSFQLVWRNLARVAAVNMVGDYLMLLGKVMVSLVTTGVCAMIMLSEGFYHDKISSPLLPAVLIFLLAWIVASVFMVVFETAIDTTFLCFLVDCEHNGGSGKMLASDELQQLVGKYSEESQKSACEQKRLRGEQVEIGAGNNYSKLSS